MCTMVLQVSGVFIEFNVAEFVRQLSMHGIDVKETLKGAGNA